MEAFGVQKLLKLVKDAIDNGANLLCGVNLDWINKGAADNYFPITVIEKVNEKMALMESEAFGPIIAITEFGSDEEAVRIPNDSGFDFSCAIFSGSEQRARDIASQIRCGVATVNGFASNYMCGSFPFGGVKNCGFGGVEGLRACCLVRYVMEGSWWLLHKTEIIKPMQCLLELLSVSDTRYCFRALLDAIKFVSGF